MGWIKDKLIAWFGPGYIKSIARGLSKALAGVLGAYGYNEGAGAEVITAVLLYLLSQGLSFLDKKKTVNELPPAKQ